MKGKKTGYILFLLILLLGLVGYMFSLNWDSTKEIKKVSEKTIGIKGLPKPSREISSINKIRSTKVTSNKNHILGSDKMNNVPSRISVEELFDESEESFGGNLFSKKYIGSFYEPKESHIKPIRFRNMYIYKKSNLSNKQNSSEYVNTLRLVKTSEGRIGLFTGEVVVDATVNLENGFKNDLFEVVAFLDYNRKYIIKVKNSSDLGRSLEEISLFFDETELELDIKTSVHVAQ